MPHGAQTLASCDALWQLLPLAHATTTTTASPRLRRQTHAHPPHSPVPPQCRCCCWPAARHPIPAAGCCEASGVRCRQQGRQHRWPAGAAAVSSRREQTTARVRVCRQRARSEPDTGYGKDCVLHSSRIGCACRLATNSTACLPAAPNSWYVNSTWKRCLELTAASTEAILFGAAQSLGCRTQPAHDTLSQLYEQQ